MHSKVGVIGYGEVGKIFASGLKPMPGVAAVAAWDLKFSQPNAGLAHVEHAQKASVFVADGMAGLCARADFLISAVTASNTLAVAEEAARHLQPGTLFLDLNSASPGTKQAAAAAIEAAGGFYVEAGVMTSIPPKRIKVPLLLGGAGAETLAPLLVQLGFDAKVASRELGVASAVIRARARGRIVILPR